jgi:hypothetical protein
MELIITSVICIGLALPAGLVLLRLLAGSRPRIPQDGGRRQVVYDVALAQDDLLRAAKRQGASSYQRHALLQAASWLPGGKACQHAGVEATPELRNGIKEVKAAMSGRHGKYIRTEPID